MINFHYWAIGRNWCFAHQNRQERTDWVVKDKDNSNKQKTHQHFWVDFEQGHFFLFLSKLFTTPTMGVDWVGGEQFCWCSLGCSPRHCPFPAGQGFFWSCAWNNFGEILIQDISAEIDWPIFAKNIHSRNGNLAFGGVVHHRYEQLVIFMILKLHMCKNSCSLFQKYGQDGWLAPIQVEAKTYPISHNHPHSTCLLRFYHLQPMNIVRIELKRNKGSFLGSSITLDTKEQSPLSTKAICPSTCLG